MNDTFKYVEIVTGGVTNRGNYTECRSPFATLDYFDKDIEKDSFHSAFIQSKDLLDYVDQYGGKTGYDGAVGSEFLFWDFDSSDLEVSFEQAKTLVYKLTNFNPSNIRIHFSGCKGFHITYYCPELKGHDHNPNINKLVKSACAYLAYGMDSFDGHIYDKTRLIRIANTVNTKTGLYKIELDCNKLGEYTTDQIKEMAKERNTIPFEANDNTSPSLEKLLYNVSMNLCDTKTRETKVGQSELIEGIRYGFSEGARNDGLTSTAGLLRSRGLSSNFIHSFLASINSNSASPIPDGELWTIVNSVSKYSINPLYIEPSGDDVLTMNELEDKWLTLRKKAKKLNSGFKHLDECMPFFDPGEVMFIAARSGIGKTTLGMQLCHGIANSHDGYGLMASLEMPSTSIFVRSAIIEQGKSVDTSALSYEEISANLLKDEALRKKVIDSWHRLLVIDKTGVSIEQLRTYFELANEKYDYGINNFLVDYVGLISGASDYQGISEIARGLKGLAKMLNTRIIVIVQLSRKAGDGTIPVSIDMLRDSGALEESADYILGMWLSTNDKSRIHASLIKNRFGERNQCFDIINNSLNYTTEDYKEG